MCIKNNATEKLDSKLAEIVLALITDTKKNDAAWSKGFISFLPKNAITGKYYKGGNIITVGDHLLKTGSKFNKILTFKQAADQNVRLKKGVHGGMFGKYIDYKKYLTDEQIAELPPYKQMYVLSDKKGKYLEIPTLKNYFGFTLEQTEDAEKLNALVADDTAKLTGGHDLDLLVQTLLKKSGAKVHYGLICAGSCPHYSHSTNYINGELVINDIYLPDPKQITDSSIYNGIAVHELAHWTKNNIEKLKRADSYNRKTYAYEELIAESASALFCARFGIVNKFSNHIVYIKDWAKAIKDDPSCIRKAMSVSQKIVNYFCELLGVDFDNCDTDKLIKQLKAANKPASKKAVTKKAVTKKPASKTTKKAVKKTTKTTAKKTDKKPSRRFVKK